MSSMTVDMSLMPGNVRGMRYARRRKASSSLLRYLPRVRLPSFDYYLSDSQNLSEQPRK